MLTLRLTIEKMLLVVLFLLGTFLAFTIQQKHNLQAELASKKQTINELVVQNRQLETSLHAERQATEDYYAEREKNKKHLMEITKALQKALQNNGCASESLPDTVIEQLRKQTQSENSYHPAPTGVSHPL